MRSGPERWARMALGARAVGECRNAEPLPLARSNWARDRSLGRHRMTVAAHGVWLNLRRPGGNAEALDGRLQYLG